MGRRQAFGMGRGRGRTRARPSDDDRILPLINIVFLLLIFFMAVGRLSAADPFRIEPPRSESTGAAATEPHLIAVGAEGQLALDGTVLDEAALLARLAPEAGAPIPEIRIKSDGGAEAVRVIALIEALRQRGIATVRLMTVPVPVRGVVREPAVGGSG
ncbi:MAG: biopolymer transporter ExbD [Pseudomonadota bacterium]